jgi:ABC-type glycerol-3-phosphate transport system permease component
MKLKNILLVLVLIIEALGIFWYSLTISKDNAKHVAVIIQVPENMMLTIANDICFSVDKEKEITVTEGTKITPDYIFSNCVIFSYEGYIHISAEFNDFVEHAQLEDLENVALQDKVNRQKEYVLKGVIIGIIVGVCWVILGTVIAYPLIKKEAVGVLIIVHFIVIILLSLMIYGSHQYLSK